MAHRYNRHKITKHRTIEVPAGFDFLEVKRDDHQPNTIRVVFKKVK